MNLVFRRARIAFRASVSEANRNGPRCSTRKRGGPCFRDPPTTGNASSSPVRGRSPPACVRSWRGIATTDPVQAARYWATANERLLPTVLLRSGTAFRLVSVAGNLAQWALRTEMWESQPGPVLYRGDLARAYFLVDKRELSVSGHHPDEVVAMTPGDWTAAPPSRIRGVNVIWWVAPEAVDWRPASASTLTAALTRGCRDRRTARASARR